MIQFPATKFLWIAFGLAVLSTAPGCQAGRENRPNAEAALPSKFDRPAQLPAVADLPRAASATTSLLGSQFYEQHGGAIHNEQLILTDPSPVVGEAGDKGVPDPAAFDFAFALYLFGGVTEAPVAFSLATDTNYQRRYWLGVADWETGSWVFLPHQYTATSALAMDDLPGGAAKYLSPEGALAIVAVLDNQPDSLTINQAALYFASDPVDFTASQNNWQGIKLTWQPDYSTTGYRVASRLAGQDWVLLTDPALPKLAAAYDDETAPAGVEVEYRLQQALWLNLMGETRTFWSPGAIAIGKRPPTTVSLPVFDIGSYWPVNLYNRLGFFLEQAGSTGSIDLIQNSNYPPDGSWIPLDGGVDIPDFIPERVTEWPTPFAVYQPSLTNSLSLLAAYSDATGCYARVAAIDSDGTLAWEEPQLVRDAGNILLGLTALPLRVAMITWNTNTNRMEMVDSEDIPGQFWFPYDPVHFRHHIIGTRMPDGPIEFRTVSSTPFLCFRELGTGLPVLLQEAGIEGWLDDSPDFLTVAPGPRYVSYTISPGIPVTGLLYLEPDRRTLRLLKRLGTYDWTKASLSTWAQVDEGHTITEFNYMALGGDSSTSNILLYITDGNLYLRYSTSQNLSNWGEPQLLDDAGTCHELRIVPVGSDANYSSYLFATFLTTDNDGNDVINYRELKAVVGVPYS